jgi:hypothetical protein
LGIPDYQGNDGYQITLRLRYCNPLEAGDWRGAFDWMLLVLLITTRVHLQVILGNIVPAVQHTLQMGGWIVPIDAIVTHRVLKNWVVVVGASK